MRKYFWSIILSIVVGIYLGKFTLNQYDDFNVFPVSYGYDTLYFLQQGVYSNEDIMKQSMSGFQYYIYNAEEDGYHAYVGITKSIEIASKIKEYFKTKGYDIYVKEDNVSNLDFVSVVNQYDLLLVDASGDAIEDICNHVLSSYEELVINENKNEGHSEE